jgi:DNA-binding NtrC family response regulator
VRELRNVVERAVALCPGPQVGLEDLPEPLRAGGGGRQGPCVEAMPLAGGAGAAWPDIPSTLEQSKQGAEVRRIQEALQSHNNNRLRAAAELGISRTALYKKLHKYGLM